MNHSNYNCFLSRILWNVQNCSTDGNNGDKGFFLNQLSPYYNIRYIDFHCDVWTPSLIKFLLVPYSFEFADKQLRE